MISGEDDGERICGCCGELARTWIRGVYGRCAEHEARNPCAIEGCRRTRAVPSSGRCADDQWLCGEHWRRFVPPRSRARRAYHAHFRRAKRLGWTDERARAFWALWNAIIRMARRRAGEGFVNEAEINRLMGWD